MKGPMLAAVILGAMVCGVSLMAQAVPGDSQQTAQSAPAAALKPGIEILSDTMGVDFSGYLRRLHNDILHNWDPLIPAKAQPPNLKKGAAAIRLTILPDGTIGSMKLETSSGDVDLDKAAWYALTSEGTFPPLPKAFHGPRLELRVGFFYNTPVVPAK
jgi:TonB family protein